MAWWHYQKQETPTFATVEAALIKINVDDLKKYVALVDKKKPPLRKGLP